jgi:hypothetical protein
MRTARQGANPIAWTCKLPPWVRRACPPCPTLSVHLHGFILQRNVSFRFTSRLRRRELDARLIRLEALPRVNTASWVASPLSARTSPFDDCRLATRTSKSRRIDAVARRCKVPSHSVRSDAHRLCSLVARRQSGCCASQPIRKAVCGSTPTLAP